MEISQLIKVSYPFANVAELCINRPEKLNSITYNMFREIGLSFEKFAVDPEVRVIVITGNEKFFSAGGDIFELAGGFPYDSEDPARKALYLQKIFRTLSESFECIEKCGKPVIAAVSGICIGSGLEMVLSADIRYCTKNMKFSLKEVNNGITSWMGGVQKIQKLIGANSWIREILFTGRYVDSEESYKTGLFSRVFETYKEMMDYTMEMAQLIASKSPVALYGTKTNLNFSRDHPVKENFDFTANWNSWSYQTNDLTLSISSQLQKTIPVFPRL